MEATGDAAHGDHRPASGTAVTTPQPRKPAHRALRSGRAPAQPRRGALSARTDRVPPAPSNASRRRRCSRSRRRTVRRRPPRLLGPGTATRRNASTGSDLPFNSSGSTGSTSTAAARELHGLRADVHLVRRRRLLEPRRDVHGVAGDETLARARDDLAGVDADARLHAERRQRVAHLVRGSQRAQRVVLVQHRHAEDGHHRVADELLDRAAVALDDRLHPVEVAREQRAQRLGIRRLAERRRAGDVAEDDR